MKCPHTHYTKGKTVWLRLKTGEEYTGKFIERKARSVILDCGEFSIKQIKAMSYRKHQTTSSADFFVTKKTRKT